MDNVGDEPGECGDALIPVDLGTNLPAVKKHELTNVNQCVLFVDGSVKCWGSNKFGKLGHETGFSANYNSGSKANQMGDNLPFTDIGDWVAKDIFTTHGNTCIWTTTDEFVCWGRGDQGGLGYPSSQNVGQSAGTMGNNLKAVDFGSYNGDARYVIDAACGAYHCCVILNDNEVVCWGPCNWQVCGQEATTAQSIGSSESHVGDNFQPIDFSAYPGRYPTEITCGYYHCCVFLDGTSELACWGSNSLGALGQGNGEHSTVPLLIQDLGTPAQACSEGGSGSSTGGSPQASVAVPKGTTMCYKYLDMETKMADLTELLKVSKPMGLNLRK
jgi:alpha-tubulin suppressor-like RCC1 family protein